MEKTTEIVGKPALHFGAYPDPNIFEYLQTLKIDTLVDLTSSREILKAKRYSTEGYTYIHYPIKDRRAPTDITTFKALIEKLLKLHTEEKNIYIHCKGGHGRSGVLAVILYRKINNTTLEKAIKEIHARHSWRPGLSKNGKRGIPQTKIQAQFLKDYYSDKVYFYDKSRIYYEFSNFYPSKVIIDKLEYPTTEHYYQCMKYPDYPEYQALIRKQSTPGKAFYLGRRVKRKQYGWMKRLNELIDLNPAEIDETRDKNKIMLKALRAKFVPGSNLAKLLLSTGEREIHEDSPRDSYWGLGKDGKGESMLGKLLMKIREELKSKKEAKSRPTLVQYDMCFPSDNVKEALKVINSRLRVIVTTLANKEKEKVSKEEDNRYTSYLLSGLNTILRESLPENSNTSSLFRQLETLLRVYKFSATEIPFWKPNKVE